MYSRSLAKPEHVEYRQGGTYATKNCGRFSFNAA
jgi:hypothetical protein